MDLNHLNLRVRDPGACRDFYQRHFGFRPAFEAEGGYFIRNDDGFLLALVPTGSDHRYPEGFHIGFGQVNADAVTSAHEALSAARVRITDLEDHRPTESYVTFRCWDPDGIEIEVFWEVEQPRQAR